MCARSDYPPYEELAAIDAMPRCGICSAPLEDDEDKAECYDPTALTSESLIVHAECYLSEEKYELA